MRRQVRSTRRPRSHHLGRHTRGAAGGAAVCSGGRIAPISRPCAFSHGDRPKIGANGVTSSIMGSGRVGIASLLPWTEVTCSFPCHPHLPETYKAELRELDFTGGELRDPIQLRRVGRSRLADGLRKPPRREISRHGILRRNRAPSPSNPSSSGNLGRRLIIGRQNWWDCRRNERLDSVTMSAGIASGRLLGRGRCMHASRRPKRAVVHTQRTGRKISAPPPG